VQTYSSKVRLAALLAIMGAVAAAFVGGRIIRIDQPGEHFWLVYPALLALCAIALAASLPWWRRLDDMQRTGHLASLYWGGQAGMLAVMMALIAATGPRSELSRGSLLTVVGIGAGYLVFLAGWRLRQRGPEE
jgi:hypothetical protein